MIYRNIEMKFNTPTTVSLIISFHNIVTFVIKVRAGYGEIEECWMHSLTFVNIKVRAGYGEIEKCWRHPKIVSDLLALTLRYVQVVQLHPDVGDARRIGEKDKREERFDKGM
jgi:hypothetical protein